MPTKIIQLDIGRGTQWGTDLVPKVIREICIPSAKAYAKKHGYEYELITKSRYEKEVGELNFLATRNKHFSFERYLNLDSDHDQIAYIDNDVYISDAAEPLPVIEGISASYEPGFTNSRNIFIQENGLVKNHEYINSGVIFSDRHAARTICSYMIDRAKNKRHAKGKNTDNMMFNEFVLEYPGLFSVADEKWNYMPMLPGSTKGLDANFMHLIGIPGKKLLEQLVLTRMPLKPLLEKITIGEIKLDLS